ncbi:hypothetical protein TNCV_2689491 [Trichonephila clavipes]|nr:hypothetical protein TNCV_2689491 [Trichonephila clavipes]
MSFHKKIQERDLINVLKKVENKLLSKETIIELKTKLEKSAAFKDDRFCDKSAKFVLRGQAGESRTAAARDQLTTRVSETFDECLCDVSHISNSGIRDKVQTLIENYCPNKTETTALKMKIILSDEKPIAQGHVGYLCLKRGRWKANR